MNRERAFLLVSIAVFLALSLALLLPFLQYVLAAVLLGYVLAPLHRRLAPRLGPRVAAALLILVAFVALIVPLAVVIRAALRDASVVLDAAREFLAGTTAVEEFVGFDVRVGDILGSAGTDGSTVIGGLLGVIGGISDALVGLTVLLFVLYYLLTSGAALVRWIRRVTPLSASTQDRLHDRVDRLMWGVVVVNVVVGVVQGILTGIGLWAVGIPNALFWTVVTTALSLLPMIGASVVWVPAAAILLLGGEPLRGVALAVYGAGVVSLSDNYLRPVVGGREARLNPGLFVVGIFGGLAAFGVMGLFFGPVVLGVLKALVEVYAIERPATDRGPGA